MRFVDGLIGADTNQQLNSHGHRCKELNELNFRNYILFVGDNAGLKLDLPIEETFPYITSKQTGMDYYNLAVFNGGLDVVKNNLIVWLNKFPAPRAIVVSCEFVNALTVSNNNREYLNSADLDDPVVNDMIDAANKCGFFLGRQYLFDRMVSNLTSIPVYQVAIKDKINSLNTKSIDIDWDGVDHQAISDKLSSVIKQSFQKARAAV